MAGKQEKARITREQLQMEMKVAWKITSDDHPKAKRDHYYPPSQRQHRDNNQTKV